LNFSKKNKYVANWIAQVLTSEVMDENYRGTQRIRKHGEHIKKSDAKCFTQLMGIIKKKANRFL